MGKLLGNLQFDNVSIPLDKKLKSVSLYKLKEPEFTSKSVYKKSSPKFIKTGEVDIQ